MKPEQAFYQLLRPNLPGFAERIENAAGAGTPDFHCILDGATYWVEAKAPKTKTFDLIRLLEPSQIAWYKRYDRYGGRVFFIVRCADEIHVFENLTERILLLQKPWDWSALKTALATKILVESR